MSESLQLLQAAATRGLIPADQASRKDLHGLDAQTVADRLVTEGHITATQAGALMAEVGKASAKKEPPVVGGCRLLAKLGQGGMGAVYRAEQVSMGRQVAVKVLLPQFAKDRTFAQRFLREARAAGAVNHPNVITCYDAGEDSGHLYMVMELMTGGDADQLMRRQGGRLPPARALQIVADAAAGLDAIHRAGLLHRDIKPGNLFLTDQGVAKLADLGLARKAEGDERMTVTGAALGTPAYMSPEQARADGELDIRSDIYALGATLFALCCGRHPYTGTSPFAIVAQVISEPPPDPLSAAPDLPPPVADLITRTMAKDPANRPQTPADLLADLQALLSDLGPAASAATRTRSLPPGPASAPTVPVRAKADAARSGRKPLFIAVAAIGIAALAGGAFLALRPPGPPPPAPAESVPRPASTARPGPDPERGNSALATAAPVPAAAATTATANTHVPPDWIRRVGSLQPSDQIKEVSEELRRRNPDWDGELKTERPETNGAVRKVHLRQWQIADISPLLGFPALVAVSDPDFWKPLDPGRPRRLRDLSPLSRIRLTDLGLRWVALDDLRALRGMPLKRLNVDGGCIRSYDGIQGMPIENLIVTTYSSDERVDLDLLAHLPLKSLSISSRGSGDPMVVGNLASIPRQHLAELTIRIPDGQDLSALSGLHLTKLNLETRTLDLAVLVRSIQADQLILPMTEAADLAPLAGSRIRHLEMRSFAKATHLEVLWSIPTLETVAEGAGSRTPMPRDVFLTRRGVPKPADR
ncbi:MAG: serine/threonine protein kinase [Planctomycetes bacterium]|nr:serine/threonine protein kinase [Planctomycetota bacterium]